MKKESNKKKPEKGVIIPAGTEQETGLTRGQTEKLPDPAIPPFVKEKEKDEDDSLNYEN